MDDENPETGSKVLQYLYKVGNSRNKDFTCDSSDRHQDSTVRIVPVHEV